MQFNEPKGQVTKIQPLAYTVRTGTPESEFAPVVIIGAGACGLSAALFLQQLGIASVVLERDRVPRGSTALSSGYIPAVNTRAQSAAGIVDSMDLFKADIVKKSRATAADHLVNAYVTAIGPAMNSLESLGLDWQILDGFLYPGHSARRMHTLANQSGAGLMDALSAAIDPAFVDVVTQAQVTELWTDNDHITGVGFHRPDGSYEALKSKAVLLACNGFGGNAEKVKAYLPEISGAQFAGHSGNDGAAVDWASALGAGLSDMNAYQGHGSWATPHGILITWMLMSEGAIQVNAQGNRFHDETLGYSEAAMQVLAQSAGLAWNVYDEKLHLKAMAFPDYRQAESLGAIRRFESYAGLASYIGCDLEAIERSLASATLPLSTPLYAVKVTSALFHTQGGLSIDADCRVLNLLDKPIENLYAAGGAARGVSGNAVWGYLSGNGLLSAIAGGFIAAHSIAAHAADSLKKSLQG
jgi:fumarate reductase flavoprotein subunit